MFLFQIFCLHFERVAANIDWLYAFQTLCFSTLVMRHLVTSLN